MLKVFMIKASKSVGANAVQ